VCIKFSKEENAKVSRHEKKRLFGEGKNKIKFAVKKTFSTTKTHIKKSLQKKFCAFIILKSNIAKMFSTSVFKEVVRN
jgi:hypothetical protein